MKKLLVFSLLLVLLCSLYVVVEAENLNYYFVATFNTSPKFYTGPGTNYLRANNGKAQYGGGGEARVFGYEGKWLMLGYQTGSGNYCIGYFQDTFIANMKAPEGAQLRKLNFEYRNAWINTECNITDDPVIKHDPFGLLETGHQCTYLASYDDSWAYIEVTLNADNRKARGFVPMNNVTFSSPVPVPTGVPYYFPTPTPVPSPSGDSGFYGYGTWATCSTQMMTYSGPASYYTNTGTYFMQNQAIYCLAKHYDYSSGSWWVLCRIFDGNGAQYVWAQSSCFYNAEWLLSRLAQE